MKPFSIRTNSVAQTETLAARLAGQLEGGLVLTLSGELGAGKTIFVRGLARGLNVPPGVAVTSPTYVLQHTYRGGRLAIHHLDTYRLGGGAQEFEASGLQECWDDAEAVVCLEWPERLSGVTWPADHLQITLEHAGAEGRRITFAATGPRSESIVQQLKLAVSGLPEHDESKPGQEGC